MAKSKAFMLQYEHCTNRWKTLNDYRKRDEKGTIRKKPKDYVYCTVLYLNIYKALLL